MAQNQNIGLLGQYLTVNTAANSVAVNATSITFGNSVSNCVINSTSIYINGIDYNPTTALAIAVALS